MKLNTGDIILFSGKGFISKLIRIATRSKFSHVGIVYRKDGEEPLIFHSTSLTQPKGTKLETLASILKTYNGKIYARSITPQLSKLQIAVVKKYIRDNMHVKYESSYLELILAAIGRKLNIKVANPTSALYCSEVVANIYKLLGFIEHDKQLTPADFSKKGDWYLDLKNCVLIGEWCIND